MLSLSNIWSYSKYLLEKKTPYIWRILSIKRKHHMYYLVLNYSLMKGFFFFFFFGRVFLLLSNIFAVWLVYRKMVTSM